MDKIFDKYSEDLTNDIFLVIFKYVNKNIEIEKLDNLIWKISHNIWNKKAILYINEKNNIDIEKYKEGFNENSIDKIIYNEIVENINSFELTEKELNAFKLYYYNDLSTNEISDIMKTSVSNIKYYLYSARNKIKERYYE